jgi:hypothetical protein
MHQAAAFHLRPGRCFAFLSAQLTVHVQAPRASSGVALVFRALSCFRVNGSDYDDGKDQDGEHAMARHRQALGRGRGQDPIIAAIASNSPQLLPVQLGCLTCATLAAGDACSAKAMISLPRGLAAPVSFSLTRDLEADAKVSARFGRNLRAGSAGLCGVRGDRRATTAMTELETNSREELNEPAN